MKSDQFSGLLLIAIAAYVGWENRVYSIGTLQEPGPGYMPLLLTGKPGAVRAPSIADQYAGAGGSAPYGAWCIEAQPPRNPRAQTEFSIIAVGEEIFVEAANLIQHRFAVHRGATVGPKYLLLMVELSAI